MIIGETPSERYERLSVRDELNLKMRKMGNREFIDIFTTVPDHRTTKEILSREPKCVVEHRMKQLQQNVTYPAQCSCGHLFLEKYQFSEPNKNGEVGLCWCGFCKTKLMVKPPKSQKDEK